MVAARIVPLVLVLLAAGFAGCLGGDDAAPREGPAREISVADPPASAKVERVGTEVHLTWSQVSLPFRETITVPAHATLVRLVTVGPAGVAVRSSMVDADTGRRRCNTDTLNAWNVGITGTHVCTGTSLIDPPGAKWRIASTGPATAKADVRIELSAAPLDGIAGRLNLNLLSMPTFAVTPTKGEYFPSFDGTRIWAEVTLPEGPGPWPTVIASSPYNGQSNRINRPGGTPAMWAYFTHDWARRGYAVVNADVRGFGLSDGCVEVWGTKEQKDQAALVEWVVKQPWSDGHAGFYGQSYVGTTPVAAAVQAPQGLDAIIAVAPVISAYDDWHYGGVSNGENFGSPVAYQVLTDAPGQGTTPEEIVRNKAKGICDPTLLARANDPRGVYDDYYKERNFKLRANQVKAAVLFTEGFEDSNVKSSMIPGWFNELPGPKLGLFGHWVHQHPTRADEEILFLGWMDQYVKGRDLGFDKLPAVEVVTNVDTVRQSQLWPDPALPIKELWPDFPAGKFHAEKPSSLPQVQLALTPVGEQQTSDALRSLPFRMMARATYQVETPLAFSGVASLHVRGTLNTQGNGYLAAQLYDESEKGRQLVTYGMFNLAHEKGHDTFEPVAGRASNVSVPFLPTEWVFEPGHRLVVELRAVHLVMDGLALPGPPGLFTVGQHPQGVGALRLPVVDLASYQPIPAAARP